eukprot:CAMPEP_0170564186 /NCGR_PEP_ID=MMETSP0211-20121228/71466_1 /TAXON_ID=311385 /ORGANISM="Pseudokeronopsis sp., Strain OXSARD2" /LENGTH=173 /DNA_ID=CAMNT_0010883345 /DNA_START=1194 /DNA_END=1715 /DNA_ORIENTATION=-
MLESFQIEGGKMKQSMVTRSPENEVSNFFIEYPPSPELMKPIVDSQVLKSQEEKKDHKSKKKDSHGNIFDKNTKYEHIVKSQLGLLDANKSTKNSPKFLSSPIESDVMIQVNKSESQKLMLPTISKHIGNSDIYNSMQILHSNSGKYSRINYSKENDLKQVMKCSSLPYSSES